MACNRQNEARVSLRSWQGVLLCFLACTLALFFVTRFVDFSGSFFSLHQINPSSGIRSVAHLDHLQWSAPRLGMLVLPAESLLAQDPLPPRPLQDDLYNRPPPSFS